MSDVTLTITMSQPTQNELRSGGYILYAFKAVKSSNKSGVPLVWHSKTDYLTCVPITLSSALVAFISNDEIKPDHVIRIGTPKNITLSQIMTVCQDGQVTVSGGFVPYALEIASKASKPFTCGIAQAKGTGNAVPYCAFTLNPNLAVPIEPLQKIFVMFATSTYDLGAYMVQTLGDGLCVDLTGVTKRDINYDKEKGWQPTDQTWAERFDMGTKLASFLIERPVPNQPLLVRPR